MVTTIYIVGYAVLVFLYFLSLRMSQDDFKKETLELLESMKDVTNPTSKYYSWNEVINQVIEKVRREL